MQHFEQSGMPCYLMQVVYADDKSMANNLMLIDYASWLPSRDWVSFVLNQICRLVPPKFFVGKHVRHLPFCTVLCANTKVGTFGLCQPQPIISR